MCVCVCVKILGLEKKKAKCIKYEKKNSYIVLPHGVLKEENIGNHGYIGTSILRIYRRYIDGYFGKKYR